MKKKEILASFNFRHACKEFDRHKKISKEDFNFILETARLSPSSFGFEPWKIIVLQNQELRDILNNKIWGALNILPTCSHFIIILGKKKSLLSKEKLTDFMTNVYNMEETKINLKLKKFENFIKNDFKMDDEEKIFEWSCRQTYILLSNVMTTSSMIGIDSCAIEGFSKDIMDEFISEYLKINLNEYGTSVMCAFGYRLNNQPEKKRNKIDDIVSWV